MFDRALGTIATAALIGASVTLAVFAAGFAVFALAEPLLGAAGAAALVAALGAAIVAGAAALRMMRVENQAREMRNAQSELTALIGDQFKSVLEKHPLAAVGATALAGFLAARNPQVVRELVQAFRAPPR